MSTATFIPTKLKKSQVINAGPQAKFDSDVLKIILVQVGSGIPSTINTGVQFVADITATNTEVSGTNYSRQTLASVTVAFDGSVNTQVDFSFANVTYTQSGTGFSNARYGAIYDSSIGSTDATFPVLAVLDLGATFGNVSGDLVLQCPAGGLIQWS
jgi:hypothetical protein